MHCPRCGHQQSSEAIRFCTKCGLEIGDVKQFLAPELREKKAKRKKEINKAARQGMAMMLFGFVLIMLLTLFRDYFNIPKAFITISMLVFCIGGAIRMCLPYLFGGNKPAEKKDESAGDDLHTTKLTGDEILDKSLPEAEFRPPVTFGKQSYDTNELISPTSVTEDTTRRLKKRLEQE